MVVDNVETLQRVMSRIGVGGPLADMMWCWHVEPCGDGWLMWATFRRPDRHTAEIGIGRSRREFIERGTSDSAVIQTAWVILDMTTRHEAMEAFRVDGAILFDPHLTVEDLMRAQAGV